MIEYKVAETSIVTDDQLEGIINEWVGRGWSFDGIHFVRYSLRHSRVIKASINGFFTVY